MSANVLTVLVPSIIASVQRVTRQSGAIFNLFSRDPRYDAAAVGQTIDMVEEDAAAVYDVTAGPTPPAFVGHTPTSRPLVIERFKGSRFHLTGEDWRAIEVQGPEHRVGRMEEAVAALVHDAAAYAFGIVDSGAARAIGTAGASPFATNADPLIDVWEQQSGDDYRVPQVGRIGVLSVADWAKAGKLATFQKANEAPAGVSFNSLSLGTLANYALSWDQAIGTHTAGNGSGYLVAGAAAVGALTLTLDTGSGTILAGDVVHFGADTTRKYVVASFSGGVLTLNAPLTAAVADNASVTLAASHKANILCHPDAYALAIRPPAEAPEGDAADMVQVIRDPVTGLAMRLAHYKGYHAGQWELSWVFGGAKRKPKFATKLLG